MTSYEQVKASNVWDPRFDLPTTPQHNNPWIYTAYVCRVLSRCRDISWEDGIEMNARLQDQLMRCEVEPGFISRWPGDEGVTSHDELIGAAYLDSEFAGRAYALLKKKWGFYRRAGQPLSVKDFIPRFVFVIPFLKAAAHLDVGIFGQLVFSLHVFWEMNTAPGDVNDRLKIWMMAPFMRQYPISGWALGVWERYWISMGCSPKSMFSNNYLTECPVMGELAVENFR